MKFCPNCGYPFCWYNVDTNQIDEKIYEVYKKKGKDIYKKQCDNIPFGMNMKNCINTSTKTIYNKENDNITGSYELVKLMSKFKNKKDKK